MESMRVRVPSEMREKMDELARQNDRTLSQEVRHAMRLYIKTNEMRAAARPPGGNAA